MLAVESLNVSNMTALLGGGADIEAIDLVGSIIFFSHEYLGYHMLLLVGRSNCLGYRIPARPKWRSSKAVARERGER